MSSRALNGHIDQANFVLATVWYETNAALIEGQAVCYNYDYTGGGATVAEGSRSNRVESVSATNAQWFAGVSSAEYSAVSGGTAEPAPGIPVRRNCPITAAVTSNVKSPWPTTVLGQAVLRAILHTLPGR